MNHSAFDAGTLSWVRNEIDLALRQAGEALARHAARPDGTGALAEARRHLHQASGALALVGLAGVTHFAASIESRLATLAEAAAPDVVAVCAAAGTALAALRRYLDDLVAGHPDQPLRLYPHYRALALAAGESAPAPLALFLPDLDCRPPHRETVTALPPPRLRALRLGFARGLAKWRAGEARGLTEMRNALAHVEHGRATPDERNLWWVALAWFATLDAQAGPAPDETLLAGLDSQLDALARGADAAAPEALLKGLLYDIALAPPGAEPVESVRATYRLAALMPAATDTPASAATPRRDACRAPLATAMEEWERFGQGQAIALMRFCDVALLLVASAQDSNDAELARLVQAIADFAAWLRQQPERTDAEIILELAATLVLAEEAIEQDGARSQADESLFAAAVTIQQGRLDALGQGATALAPARLPWRERRLAGQTAREIRAELDAAETLLDAFFRSPGTAVSLPAAQENLQRVAGAFTLLAEEQAAQVAASAAARIAACRNDPAATVEFAALAELVAALAMYADTLAHGQPDPALLTALTQKVAVPPAPTLPGETPVVIGELSISPALFRLYVDEAFGHVALLRQTLSGPAGVPARIPIRAAHTLAGISAGTGFPSVQALAHALESALAQHSLARATPDDATRMLFARSVGSLEGMVGAIAERRTPAAEPALILALETLRIAPATPAVPGIMTTQGDDASPLAERRRARLADEIDPRLAALFIEEADEHLHQLDTGLRAWRTAPADQEVGRRMARLLHTFKGGARMCGAMGVGELAHGMETRVDQALAAGDAPPALLDGLAASLERANLLVDALRTQGRPLPDEPAPQAPAPAAAEPAPAVLLRVRADLVDRLVNDAGEMTIARGRIEDSMKGARGALADLTENVARLRGQLREFEIHAETSMQSQHSLSEARQRDFDPLELDRFTRLQELTRMMAESVNDVATVQHALLRQVDAAGEALATQSRLNRELSHALLRARMVPFATVTERLHRVVRLTARELGRQANLDIKGDDTPVDRNLLERMLAPLEHLLRNAVAHGIEAPAQRSAAGKPELGQISLVITPNDNDIALTLADDGGGLDFAAIRRRAGERGLLADGAPADIGDENALVDLIFRPGFSTATAVSEIAGRGVGLDVVRDEVVRLGGRIAVGAEAGHGTRFEIVLPLTLALIPVMLVRAAGQVWAIPAAMIVEARELTADEMAARRAAGSLTHDGRRYAWHSLPQLYGMADERPATGWQFLLASAGDHLALEVEALLQSQEVVVKPPGDQLARVPGLTGATVLPDGTVALIVNPVALARRGVAYAPRISAVTPGPTFDDAAPRKNLAATVMVVDDSLTVRKITGRLLERAGYRVMTAKDGMDALEQIDRQAPDVLLADIEMPRMDGFELVRALRADPRFAAVPVIMISSRSAAKHRQVARDLGVRHYLGKPYDEDELLGLIAELVMA